MGLLDALGRFLAIEPMQARSVNPVPFSSFETQLAQIRRDVAAPWTPSTIVDALAVPAIHRAVTLIANTVGTLSLEAWSSGALVAQADTPRILVRPNPFSTPFEFFRDWGYSLATRGEAWHWIAARDTYGTPLSLFPMPAQEVFVTVNDRDLLRPNIQWRDKVMRNEDVIQTIQSREPGDLRGSGPLQRCGAAVSVAVESQEWAANFFGGGGLPSILIKSAVALTEDEAKALKSQWYETPSNVPRVIDPGIEDVKDFSMDPVKAQLTDTRRYSKGEAALMFGIPGSLMDYAEPGSSLTYANVSQVYDQFLKACLLPYYLAPIEQAMSDLLTRATTAKFNVDGLLRADVKTRYDVYNVGVTSGVLSVDEARIAEGLAPGSVETAPVPPAPPAAVPSSLPIQRTAMLEIRCDGKRLLNRRIVACNKLLSTSGAFVGICPRCKKEHVREELPRIAPAAIPLIVRAAEPEPPAVIEPTPEPEPTMRDILEALPAMIAAAMPRPQAPTINVTSPPVTFAEGAIRVENTLTPPQVTLADGAVRVQPAIVSEAALTELGDQLRTETSAAVDRAVEAQLSKPAKAKRVTAKRDESGRLMSAIVEELTEG